jgi:hypothetical protein
MSKQEEAKAAQSYTTAVINCGNCAHRMWEVSLDPWMEMENRREICRGDKPRYSIESHGTERKQRCGIGGFSVKKTATCAKHTPK